MGRVLLILALAALAACEPPAAEPEAGAALVVAAATPVDSAHGELACAACHMGESAGRRTAAVPATSCASGDCHPDEGPATVVLDGTQLDHRMHAEGTVATECAGCHVHVQGGEPLAVSTDACALCHAESIAGDGAQCRACHVQPGHTSLTSQGVAVPHSSLPWVETGCVRCHYDVAAPPTGVATARCESCHAGDGAIERGAGRDLHPDHTAFACTSCHEAGAHRLVAMSSAVSLVCADCHRVAHELTLASTWPGAPPTCGACHRDVHAPQQQLLLGIVPDAEAAPSAKFIAGITCRSCHVPEGAPADVAEPIRGTAESCAGCHRSEYQRVLDWWLDGLAERERITGQYLGAAERALAGETADTVQNLLGHAREVHGLIATAGGQHNLELSDRLFRRILDWSATAYRAAGRTPPSMPDLGRQPHVGLCSYCHYAPDDPWDFSRMSPEFHRSLRTER